MSHNSTLDLDRYSSLEKSRRSTSRSQPRAQAKYGDVLCDFCTSRKQKAEKSCLVCLANYCETHIQTHYDYPALMKHKLVKATGEMREKMCAQHDKLLEAFCRTDETSVCVLCMMDEHKHHDIVPAGTERTEKQKQLGTTLHKSQQRIDQRLKKWQDLRQAVESVKSWQSLSGPSGYEDLNNITVAPYYSFDATKRAIATLKLQVEEVSKTEMSKISGAVKEVYITQEDSCQLILDVNSVHPSLHLSEGNRTATMKSEPKNYPEHPDRFDHWQQVVISYCALNPTDTPSGASLCVKATHSATTGFGGGGRSQTAGFSGVSRGGDAWRLTACESEPPPCTPIRGENGSVTSVYTRYGSHTAVKGCSVSRESSVEWSGISKGVEDRSACARFPPEQENLEANTETQAVEDGMSEDVTCCATLSFTMGDWVGVRLYNQSCEEELYLQSGPTLCCTLDNVPLISKCGTLPPESCFFSLICSTGSFMVMVIVLLRYAHVIEKHQNCVLNTASLSTGWICAAGLIMVGNFQVDNAKVLHYVGAGIAFPTSMLFVCLQSALTYRLAKTQGEYNVAHLRLCMTLLAFVALVLSILTSGVFFCQESFVLQHASAIFEWVFCVIIMLFYGTFAFEFASMSGDTMVVLARGGTLGPAGREHKVDALGAHAQPHPHQPENMSIL
ncbi:hypothetical protein INR49_021756 [Caranx melampygus]|nr:hypothetical protein INR49_021756 [Caranx melampygus]